MACPWSLRDRRAGSFQVRVLAVVAQEGADEWAQGDELEVPGAQVVQGAGNEAGPEPRPSTAGSTSVWTSRMVPGSDRYSMKPARVAPNQSS